MSREGILGAEDLSTSCLQRKEEPMEDAGDAERGGVAGGIRLRDGEG